MRGLKRFFLLWCRLGNVASIAGFRLGGSSHVLFLRAPLGVLLIVKSFFFAFISLGGSILRSTFASSRLPNTHKMSDSLKWMQLLFSLYKTYRFSVVDIYIYIYVYIYICTCYIVCIYIYTYVGNRSL